MADLRRREVRIVFGNTAEKRIAREADKVASLKEDLDALSWGRVLDIGKLLQTKGPEEADLGAELVSIAQANLSLATRLGIDPAPPEGRVMASGIEIVEGGLAEAALEGASAPEVAEAACGQAADDAMRKASVEVPVEEAGFGMGETEEGGEADTFDPQEPPHIPAFRSKTELPIVMASPARAAESGFGQARAPERQEASCEDGEQAADEPPHAPAGECEAGPSTEAEAEGAVDAASPTLPTECENEVEDPTSFDPEPAPDPVTRDLDSETPESAHPAAVPEPVRPAEASEPARPAEVPEAVQPAAASDSVQPAAAPEPRAGDESRPADETTDREGSNGRTSRKRFARFRHLYESRDGALCVFEDEHGHLMAVDASKLA